MAEAETKKTGGLGETLGQAGTTVKDGIVGSLKGLGEIEGQMVTVARNTVADALQATGSVATETINISRDVIKGAIKASEEVGTGLIVTTSRLHLHSVHRRPFRLGGQSGYSYLGSEGHQPDRLPTPRF
jgi:hypothetical protein